MILARRHQMNGHKKVDDVNNRVCNLGGSILFHLVLLRSNGSLPCESQTTDDNTDHLAEGLTRPNKIMPTLEPGISFFGAGPLEMVF